MCSPARGASATACSSAVVPLSSSSSVISAPRTVEVRGRIPSSADDFVDGTSCNGFQVAGRSSEWEDDLVDDLRVTVGRWGQVSGCYPPAGSKTPPVITIPRWQDGEVTGGQEGTLLHSQARRSSNIGSSPERKEGAAASPLALA